MATYYIIGGDSKEYGPISAQDIELWIREGRLNAQSMVRSDTVTNWTPLGSFPEFAGVLHAPPPTLLNTPASGPEWETAVLAGTPELKLGECLAAGWSFLGANAGFVIGAVFLTWVMNFGLVLIASFVPLIGGFVMICFQGVVMGGFYQACLRRMRGQSVGLGEVFCGFRDSFGQLVLAGLVSMLLIEFSCCLFVLPMIYLFVAWAFTYPLVTDRQMPFWPAMELSRKVVTKVWFETFALILIAYLPMVVIQGIGFYMNGKFFYGLYEQAGQDFQQFAQLMQSQQGEIQKMTLKGVLISQSVFLVNLFYIGGVMMRAYENLFGSKKS